MGQVWHSNGFSNRSSGVTCYEPIFGQSSGGSSAEIDKDEVEAPIPISGTLTHLHVILNSTPGTGKYITVDVIINGSTKLSVTIISGAIEGNDDSSVAISAGDKGYVRIRSSSSGAQRIIYFSLAFFADSSAADSCLIGRTAKSSSTQTARLIRIVSIGTWISNLYVLLETAPGDGKSWTYTLLKNDVATDLSVVITGTSTTGSDLLHEVEVIPGDKVEMRATPSGSPSSTNNGFGVKCQSLSDISLFGGQYPTAGISLYTPGYPTALYYLPIGYQYYSSVISWCLVLSNEEIISNLYAKISGSSGLPPSGKKYTFTLVKSNTGYGEEPTGLEAEIGYGETEGFSDYEVTVPKGTLLILKVTRDFTNDWWPAVEFGFSSYSLVDKVVASVITYDCTERTAVSLKANGEILSTGGENPYRRGFCYLQGTSGDPTIADDEVYEDGDFGIGAFSLDITGLTSGLPYRVRAYATNMVGIAYGNTVDSSVLIFPSDFARISSIRHIYKPGLYRMEVALGDLGFDWDVAEAAMKKIVDEVKEPEVPPEEPAKVPEPMTDEDWKKILIQQQSSDWYKAMTQPLPTWATKTTTPYQGLNIAQGIKPVLPATPLPSLPAGVSPVAAKAAKPSPTASIISTITNFFKGFFR